MLLPVLSIRENVENVTRMADFCNLFMEVCKCDICENAKKSRSGVLRLFLMPGSFDFAYASLRMTKLRGALPRFFRLIRPGGPYTT